MGPLQGIRILEFESIGPAPFAGMLLADMGADVLVIDRPATTDLGLKRERWYDVMMRGKRSVTLDLKKNPAAAVELAGKADALIEGMRPGVMERLGLGPDVVLARNPRLVYGRMTGWGQYGPLAPRARRAHGVARNPDNAPLFPQEIQRLGGFLGKANDALGVARGH